MGRLEGFSNSEKRKIVNMRIQDRIDQARQRDMLEAEAEVAEASPKRETLARQRLAFLPQYFQAKKLTHDQRVEQRATADETDQRKRFDIWRSTQRTPKQ